MIIVDTVLYPSNTWLFVVATALLFLWLLSVVVAVVLDGVTWSLFVSFGTLLAMVTLVFTATIILGSEVITAKHDALVSNGYLNPESLESDIYIAVKDGELVKVHLSVLPEDRLLIVEIP